MITGGWSGTLHDQVCPVVPEIYDLKRCEALGSDGYDYYEGFDSRSGSSDYDNPRDYQAWDDWSDIEDTEGYYDLSPGEGRTIMSLIVVRRRWPLMKR